MGYIINIIKKFLGAREIITGLLTALTVAYYVALAVFVKGLVSMLLDMYNLLRDLFDKIGGDLSLGGVAFGNDFSAIAWALLDALGITQAFSTYLPLIFSTISMYLIAFLVRILLDFKSKAIDSMYRVAIVFLG
jgi:hypothetical protein